MEFDKSIFLQNDWYKFIEYGQRPSDLKEEILKSWERSKELNIDPYRGQSNIKLSIADLHKKLEQNKKFIDITKPFMNKMYQIIKGFGYIIFLTDNEANLLHIIGDKKVLEDFQKNFNFAIGVAWSEQAVGTTAVSMVVSEGIPIPFMAKEKYCFELQKKACAAVPIRNIDGEIIGILGVAANFPEANCQIFGMLLGAEMAIENQLRMMKTNEELLLLSHYYKTIFHSVSDAIITIDSKGNITDINQKAKEILNVDVEKILGKKVKEVLDFYPVILDVLKSGNRCNNREFIIDTKDRRFRYNIKSAIPILGESGEINGCVNIFTQIKKDEYMKTKVVGTKPKYTFNDIIGNSRKIKEIKRMAQTAARCFSNILIIGESGTGKELFAQAIHNASTRVQGPFIAVNCGAIPKELIESEFFGYEGGSFTGARKEGSLGKFELASGGTIFLDEIGEMPKELQIRLLRILQEKEVTRIGGSKSIPIDVRVIAATNKDLAGEVKKGNFRDDLFWRLNVVTINIPPLAERQEDIPLLSEHFIKKHSENPRVKYILDKNTLNILLNYNWPGNVRELENVIERALIFAKNGVILPQHLPEYIKSNQQEIDFSSVFSLEETEKQVIEKVLHENGRNLTKAAKLLGISRPTLYSKLKKYQISC